MGTAAYTTWFRRLADLGGLRASVRAVLAKAWRVSTERAHPFDRRHGVDTGGLIYPDGLATGHAHDAHSAGYYATAPSLFRGALELWRRTLAGSGYALEDYTLVDIGCGKGRAVMLASESGFREVVGVELHPKLAGVARANLRRWMRRRAGRRVRGDIRIVEGDALALPFPDGPVVFFFFNSFEREMVRMWLDRLVEMAASRPAPIDLIYVHPEFGEMVRKAPGVAVLADESIAFSAEDAEADAFGVKVDQCVVYRFTRGRG